MEVVRKKGAVGYEYIIGCDDNILKISFDEKQNIYLTGKHKDKDSKHILFYITEEDYSIFEAFDHLYERLTKIPLKDERKKRSSKNKIKGNTVVFESDQDIFNSTDTKKNKSNNIIMIKEENDILLQFNYNNPINKTIFVNKTSNQHSHFEDAFTRFYDEIQNYDPNYHQMHIREYKYIKSKK